MMPAYRYLVIKGPIGAGQTSLARVTAERFSCRLELEENSANPFLKDFYFIMIGGRWPSRLRFSFC